MCTREEVSESICSGLRLTLFVGSNGDVSSRRFPQTAMCRDARPRFTPVTPVDTPRRDDRGRAISGGGGSRTPCLGSGPYVVCVILVHVKNDENSRDIGVVSLGTDPL